MIVIVTRPNNDAVMMIIMVLVMTNRMVVIMVIGVVIMAMVTNYYVIMILIMMIMTCVNSDTAWPDLNSVSKCDSRSKRDCGGEQQNYGSIQHIFSPRCQQAMRKGNNRSTSCPAIRFEIDSVSAGISESASGSCRYD
jgi:hypothetical protein